MAITDDTVARLARLSSALAPIFRGRSCDILLPNRAAGTLLPPAFGLAGVNLHTWTGSGSVPYWNAYVAATQMHGTRVTFFDPRLSDPAQYPVAARSGSWNTRGIDPANASDKLDALHYYQLSIPAPKPPKGSFDAAAAARGNLTPSGPSARVATSCG